MNPRVKLLAEQVGLKVESWMTNPPKPFQILGSTEQFEKFAELIVRECITVINQANGVGDGDVIRISRDVKKHFGVKV